MSSTAAPWNAWPKASRHLRVRAPCPAARPAKDGFSHSCETDMNPDLLKLFAIFGAVFMAELGDKTQLATLLFAAEGKHNPALVFIAAAAALCLSTALAVVIGSTGAAYLTRVPLKLIAGLGFVALGIWTLVDYWRA
ncbi:MAG TPA: TMEM165/GDT1 family protein [Dongiaceae bacterium]